MTLRDDLLAAKAEFRQATIAANAAHKKLQQLEKEAELRRQARLKPWTDVFHYRGKPVSAFLIDPPAGTTRYERVLTVDYRVTLPKWPESGDLDLVREITLTRRRGIPDLDDIDQIPAVRIWVKQQIRDMRAIIKFAASTEAFSGADHTSCASEEALYD